MLHPNYAHNGAPSPSRQTSFPELVGRTVLQATVYLSARGLTAVPVKPNQPGTMDYRANRVRIVTDPSGRIVIQVPVVG